MSKSNENINFTISDSISATNSEYSYTKEYLRGSIKMEKILALKEVIKKDNNVRDNVPLTSLAWNLCKENDYDLNNAIKSYENDKVGFMKKYQEKVSNRKKL
jgi:hypothetical protein